MGPHSVNMTTVSTLKNLNREFAETALFALMGLKIVKMGRGRAVLTVECNDQTLSHQGSLYGGVISCAADVAIWVALMSQGYTDKVVTTDLNVHYLDRFERGKASLEAVILRHGKRLIMGEVNLFNHKKILAAHVTGTFLKI